MVEIKDIAKALLEEFNDGDTVSLHWLKEAFEIKEPVTVSQAKVFQFKFLSCMDSLKSELLRKHKVALKSIRGEGYQLVPPHEQTDYAVRSGLKKMEKAITGTVDLLDHTRTDLLEADEQKRNTDALVKFSAIQGIMKKQKRDALAIVDKR